MPLSYQIIYIPLKLFSFLPFWIIYFISDFFYVILYYVVRYRKKVVFENLRNSFPEKDRKEITKIAKKFYAHFSDMFLEVLKTPNLKKNEFAKRIKVKNIELVNNYCKQNKSILFLTAHYGNWEWGSFISSLQEYKHQFIVYQLIENPFFEYYINRLIREKHNAKTIIAHKIIKKLIECKRENKITSTGLVADQTPQPKDYNYWTNFLNQETSFFTGGEKISQMLDQIVVIYFVKKVRRGYYEIEFKLLTDTPKKLPQYQLTQKYVEELEQTINEKPEYWLWTHRRWKYKKQK